ncbi:hypothetical protein CDL12_19513 [Handroanthus impetiginosus]|uniref:Uncharacterized protein n=1 Tax=Handroanthus impetiginosus TaxID=429701 RepID=A0A2G9GRK6_9LAMI|nr:hypothetical protein CDL12_19513 [Handroanthus impetiginosus]
MEMGSMANQPNISEDKNQTTANSYSMKPNPPGISIEAVKSLRPLEVEDVRLMEDQLKQQDKALTHANCCTKQNPLPAETSQPMVSRPVARVGAFNIYNASNCDSIFSGRVPMQGPLTQASEVDIGKCKFLDEPMIPLQCGHGCCAASNAHHSPGSLLGPEFIEYEETPSFSSQELLSVASDLNNIAWIRSSLENISVCMNMEENMKNDQFLFSSMTREVAST